ncbi:MAG: outer membrane beta-barrel protein [Bacteroidota bacterium]
MLKNWLLSLLCIGLTQLGAQNLTVGLSLNPGLSEVTSNLPFSGDYQTQFTLSGNAGLFIEHQLSNKSHLGLELLWVQIEGKEVAEGRRLFAVVNGMPAEIGEVSDENRIHSSYIGVPIYYRYQLGRWGFSAGAQVLLYLFASIDSEIEGTINGEPYSAESRIDEIAFDQADFGPKVGLNYQWQSKLALSLNYYHGLADLTSEFFPWQRRNRQLTLGVRYAFHQQL